MTKQQCPRCHSYNTEYKLVTDYFTKRKHRSIIAWILFWWWVEILLWLFLFIPRLLIALFAPKRRQTVAFTRSVFFCKDCGYQGS